MIGLQTCVMTGFPKSGHMLLDLGKPIMTLNILSFWYQIKELAPENAMIPTSKSYSFPLQSYECFKNHFC